MGLLPVGTVFAPAKHTVPVTGRLMADDSAVRWHIGTAALIGPDDGPDPDFTVAVREAALLLITLHDSPVGYEELASRLTELR